MLLGVLTGPDSADIRRQIEKGRLLVDGFEWRLDLFSQEALAHFRSLKKESGKLSLFTWRSASQNLAPYLPLEPEYCDIESNCPKTWVEEIAARYPKIRLLVSYHDFEGTPSDLDEVLSAMRNLPAYTYKIATQARSTIDMLRLLSFVKRIGSRISGISMGYYGQPGRILGRIVGNFFDFAIVEPHPALENAGLLTAEELRTTYRYHTLGPLTSIYALLGDPVTKSVSHITHNAIFNEKGYNAVYVKLPLMQDQLEEFFYCAAEFPFKGFSVTMPLKESVIPFAYRIEKPVQMSRALNTFVLQNGKWLGSNTDGRAAADLLEKHEPLAHKRCIIIGAGGAARAIAYELLQRKASIALVNRTLSRAKAFTEQCGGEAYSLTELDQVVHQGYDILIHATSVGFLDREECLLQERHLLPGKTLFEVVSKPTSLINLAERKNCRIILGHEHFRLQASYQYQFWNLTT